jgi:hypothetical protein
LNVLPEAGVHAMFTGDVPPVTVGGGYVTDCPLPGTPRVVMFAGHVIVGADGCGVGSFGLLHPDNAKAATTALQWASLNAFQPYRTVAYSAPIPR